MTDLRKNFGRQHAKHRRAAGLTQEEMADRMGFAVKTLQMYEQGGRTPTLAYAKKADEVLGLGGVLANLAELCRADGSPFGSFLEHEARASVIRTYSPQVVHGLLQTPDYALAVMRAADPTMDLDEGLRVRMERQEALSRSEPVRLHVILDEAVLWREIGGPGVLLEQLQKLTELPSSVVIQVLPFEEGEHAGVDGGLTLLEFPDGDDPVVNISSWGFSAIMDDPDEVKRARESLDMLMSVALSPETSAAMIRDQMEYLT